MIQGWEGERNQMRTGLSADNKDKSMLRQHDNFSSWDKLYNLTMASKHFDPAGLEKLIQLSLCSPKKGSLTGWSNNLPQCQSVVTLLKLLQKRKARCVQLSNLLFGWRHNSHSPLSTSASSYLKMHYCIFWHIYYLSLKTI